MSEITPPQPAVIFSIGHSNRPIEDFLDLLAAYDVKLLADVRKMPGSRANPQFAGVALEKSLRSVKIEYVHLAGLGGLRRGTKDSPNGGWRNASFRAFADYMLTPEFEAALGQLLQYATEKKTAIMCAEAVPWQCHRSLIADALVVRGIPVEHIMTKARTDKQKLRDFACVEGMRITYPPEDLPLFASGENA